LRAISGSADNLRKISNLANSLGGVPASGAARTSFINDLNNVAKTQKRFSRKIAKLEGGDKQARIFNPWVESRYSLAQAEQVTGKPFRRLFLNIIGQSNSASDEVTVGMTEALESIGVKKHQVILNQNQADNVTDYLFEESDVAREAMFPKLDDRSKEVVGILDDLLQGPIANEVRQARWYKWNDQYKSDILKVAKAQQKAFKKGEVVSKEQFDKLMSRSTELIPRNVVDSITDFETVLNADGTVDTEATNRNRTNAATQVLKEGSIANDAGQLRDWISSQKWGTRANFYMSESRVSDLVDFVDSQTIRELSQTDRPTNICKVCSPESVAKFASYSTKVCRLNRSSCSSSKKFSNIIYISCRNSIRTKFRNSRVKVVPEVYYIIMSSVESCNSFPVLHNISDNCSRFLFLTLGFSFFSRTNLL